MKVSLSIFLSIFQLIEDFADKDEEIQKKAQDLETMLDPPGTAADDRTSHPTGTPRSNSQNDKESTDEPSEINEVQDKQSKTHMRTKKSSLISTYFIL